MSVCRDETERDGMRNRESKRQRQMARAKD